LPNLCSLGSVPKFDQKLGKPGLHFSRFDFTLTGSWAVLDAVKAVKAGGLRMKRQERMRKLARHQALQDRSVIDHLAKTFGSGGVRSLGRRIDADAGLCEQIRKQWTGGLPQF
jgi:hypothetical protein